MMGRAGCHPRILPKGCDRANRTSVPRDCGIARRKRAYSYTAPRFLEFAAKQSATPAQCQYRRQIRACAEYLMPPGRPWLGSSGQSAFQLRRLSATKGSQECCAAKAVARRGIPL